MKTIVVRVLLCIGMTTLSSTAAIAESKNPTINLLVVVSNEFSDVFEGNYRKAIESQVRLLNETFNQQQVNASFVITGFAERNLAEFDKSCSQSLLRALIDTGDGKFDDIVQLRQEAQADIVAVFCSSIDGAVIGSSGGTTPDSAYVAVKLPGLNHMTFLHEIGHIFGLHHSDASCVEELGLITIMGTDVCMSNGDSQIFTRVPFWSDKNQVFMGHRLNGGTRDSVEILKSRVPEVSNFFERL